MAIAAVPAYLGKDFKQASPALRFGLYLSIWTDRADQEQEVRKRAEAKSREGKEVAAMLQSQGMDAAICVLHQRQTRPLPGLWEKNDFAARQVWAQIVAVNPSDRDAMKGLLDRQISLAAYLPNESICRLDACAISPFTTGLGNEHPLENGFAFLNPYGLPYLPGSGVKGVLRQAARELASGEWGERCGWSEEKQYVLLVGDERVRLSIMDVLFGLESEAGERQHERGALSFWDVIPQIAGDHLMVEIMTPHQSHYNQQKAQAGSITPHDSGQPNPICFLTVPPGSGFTFYVVCDVARLRRLTQKKSESAPDLLADGETHWKTLLEAAFQHAFQWLGFGAKTAVGYGAMRPIEELSRATARTGNALVAPSSVPSASPSARPSVPFVHTAEEQWTNATLTFQKGGGGVVKVECAQGKAEARGQQAQAILQGLTEEQRRRLEKKGNLTNVTVVVTIQGNLRQLKAVLADG